ncbi:hypothetical protein APX95_22955 [Escherichia coli]|nr:hypothetical protein APX95_22955 [Escherichia coli]
MSKRGNIKENLKLTTIMIILHVFVLSHNDLFLHIYLSFPIGKALLLECFLEEIALFVKDISTNTRYIRNIKNNTFMNPVTIIIIPINNTAKVINQSFIIVSL